MSTFSLDENVTLRVVVAADCVADKVQILSVFQSAAAEQNQINH